MYLALCETLNNDFMSYLSDDLVTDLSVGSLIALSLTSSV